MKKRMLIINLIALILLQLALALPSIAADYEATDIALSPGADETELNFNWHTNTALKANGAEECAVEVVKKTNENNKHFPQLFKFPKNSKIFYGTKAEAVADENGDDDYYCEVEVLGLENQSEYFYRVGNGKNWSDRHEYATANKNRYGFFFIADSQIGASGLKDISNSSEVKPYIAESYLSYIYLDYSSTDVIKVLKTAYTKGNLSNSNLTEDRKVEYYLATLYPTASSNLIKALRKAYSSGKLTDDDTILTEALLVTYSKLTVEADITALKSAFAALKTAITTGTVINLNTTKTNTDTLKATFTTLNAAITANNVINLATASTNIDNLYDIYSAGTLGDLEEDLIIAYVKKTYNSTYAKEALVAAHPDQTFETLVPKIKDYIDDTISGYLEQYEIDAIDEKIEIKIDALMAMGYLTTLMKEMASEIDALKLQRLADQKFAASDDGLGWAETVGIMSDKFPHGAFILSDGDQVENAREYEWTEYFSVEQLTSLPVAPAIGSHDRAENFDYHFNLPNEDRNAYDDEDNPGSFYKAGGDYYFTYGNALFIVLNMDKTGFKSFDKDSDKDGFKDSVDVCDNTLTGYTNIYKSGEKIGCPYEGDDYDGDGILTSYDLTNDGIIDQTDSCPYDTPAGNAVDSYGCTSISSSSGDGPGGGPGGPPPGGSGSSTIDATVWGEADVSDHKAFIEAAIAANPHVKWKIAMWHYSIYSAGNHAADEDIKAMRAAIIPVLDENEIDLVLMAHDHVYTRTYQMLNNNPISESELTIGRRGEVINPLGTLFITGATSSGSKYYSLNSLYDVKDDTSTTATEGPDPYFTYVKVGSNFGVPSFSYIDVDNNSLKISVYRTDTEELLDNYTIVKREPPKPQPPRR